MKGGWLRTYSFECLSFIEISNSRKKIGKLGKVTPLDLVDLVISSLRSRFLGGSFILLIWILKFDLDKT